MSGICGLFNVDGAPVAENELRAMTAMLEQRGPQRTGSWREGSAGLGHTLLGTTPELLFERQPFEHDETGCVISADVRLDNRDELLNAFKLNDRCDSTGDAELILRSWLQWGEDCVDHLLGDFAFAIWDPRDRVLFCARDHFGMRPLYYHHQQGKHFLFASDARAILVLPQVLYRINEGRIADFLVHELEWSDYTSTFYEGVYRLPPGHKALVKPSALKVTEYWRPAPVPDPGPMSDDDYRQGFLEVFTNAVNLRLRAPQGLVGAMLSGGMDSGSIVAIGKGIVDSRGAGPLATFSAARRRPADSATRFDCAESRAIYAASAMPAITPTLIHPDGLESLYESLSSDFDEPFDGVFTILNAIYLTARDNGRRVLLDGGGGDIVLHEWSYIQRLIREGHVRQAIAEINAERKYWRRGSAVSSLLRYARAAIVPEAAKKPWRAFRYRQNYRKCIKNSLISADFARSARIDDRIEHMRGIFQTGYATDYGVEYCDKILPNMTAGRERYARIAAAAGMEARDPFMDKRLIEYCSRLPGRFRLRNGWPKIILRDITAGILPSEVLWTGRKPHLGWLYSTAITKLATTRGELDLPILENELANYVDKPALTKAWRNFEAGGSAERIHYAFILCMWLRRAAARPVAPTRPVTPSAATGRWSEP